MAEIRFRTKAEADLDDIRIYSLEHFGLQVTHAYLDDFDEAWNYWPCIRISGLSIATAADQYYRVRAAHIASIIPRAATSSGFFVFCTTPSIRIMLSAELQAADSSG
ncbi:hypothetical protein [Sphingobium boeckii]|uniref:hypothetical protein n=1 Tax=Sphingobium boeckii TaxID=1082345 RepID=UPI001FE5FA2C|nr:hypothetical protein [Sphingobium boeckii]